MARSSLKVVPKKKLVKLDFGCGGRCKEGFIGVDQYKMKGVEVQLNIGKDSWPWKDETVEEAFSSHFIEHLNSVERCHFWNELYRVLIPDGKCEIIVPSWSSNRAYGDPTHKWPPIGEMSFYYLKKDWRMENAPHTDKQHWDQGLSCNFDATWGYGLNPVLMSRNQEFQQWAVNFYKEAALDIHCTVIKK